jgi:hypothetical protein
VPLASSANRGLVHPRLFDALIPKFYISRCDIQSRTLVPNAGGDVSGANATWAALDGLSDIPCSIAPILLKRGDEIRVEKTTFVENAFFVDLAGSYPEITPLMRVLVYDDAGSVTYDVLTASVNSQRTITRLVVEEIT